MTGLAVDARAAEAAVYVATYIEVEPARASEAATLLKALAAESRATDGTLGAVALAEKDRPDRLLLIEAWRDQDARSGVAARARFLARLAPLRLAPPDERVHGALSLGVPAAPGGHALWVVTHVDVIPPRQDEAAALLRHWAEASRAEPGNRRFDVLRQTERPNHFTVVEAWEDPASFAAHRAGAPTRQWREALAPMLGALYDERLYRLLD